MSCKDFDIQELFDKELSNRTREASKKLKLRELDKWYEENQELPELDDYFRLNKVRWDNLRYDRKLKIYSIITGESFEGVEIRDPLQQLRPRLGRHDFYQFMFNKYYGTKEWKNAKKTMLEAASEEASNTKYSKEL